jgi:predicted nucleic-acid-binding Zn-ribbon protein
MLAGMDEAAGRQACPKCSNAMELGLLVDSTHGNIERALEWVRGFPRRSFWRGSFDARRGDRLRITTLRCTGCGFVELYTSSPPE